MSVDVEICEHGDIRAACLDCLDAPPPPLARPPRTPSRRDGQGYVVAQFEGFCPWCEETVEVGEKVVEVEPGARRWGHADCA